MGHKKNDPHQKLESLERWSARATLLILAGIVIEIGSVFWFPHDRWERLGSAAANALVGIGLIVEYVVILRAIVASGDADRLSNEKIAAAEARAAEADRARAELEYKLQPRSLNQDQWDFIQGLRGRLSVVSIAFETDAETWWFAGQIRDAFLSAGINVAMYPRGSNDHSFGVFIFEPKGFDGARPRTVEPLVEIFTLAESIDSLAVITALPTDIVRSIESTRPEMRAPLDTPMIILGGRLVLPPPHIEKAAKEAKAAMDRMRNEARS